MSTAADSARWSGTVLTRASVLPGRWRTVADYSQDCNHAPAAGCKRDADGQCTRPGAGCAAGVQPLRAQATTGLWSQRASSRRLQYFGAVLVPGCWSRWTSSDAPWRTLAG